MDDHDRNVQHAIAAVMELYAAIDAGDVDRAVAGFTADATFTTSMASPSGTDELIRFFGERFADPERQTVHVIANARGHAVGDDAVEVQCLIVLYVPAEEGPPAMRVARIVPAVHLLQRLDARWLVARRC